MFLLFILAFELTLIICQIVFCTFLSILSPKNIPLI